MATFSELFSLFYFRGIDQAARVQGQHPQSAGAHVSNQPRIAPPQRSRWGDEPALSPIASRVPRALSPPHTRRGRIVYGVVVR